MNNTINYRGYIGSVEFSEEDCLFYGKVLGIRSLISYEGETAKELILDFHNAVDDYYEICEQEKIEPEVAFKGSFNVRIPADLHRRLALSAYSNNTSLNAEVEKAIYAYVSGNDNPKLALAEEKKTYKKK